MGKNRQGVENLEVPLLGPPGLVNLRNKSLPHLGPHLGLVLEDLGGQWVDLGKIQEGFTIKEGQHVFNELWDLPEGPFSVVL